MDYYTALISKYTSQVTRSYYDQVITALFESNIIQVKVPLIELWVLTVYGWIRQKELRLGLKEKVVLRVYAANSKESFTTSYQYLIIKEEASNTLLVIAPLIQQLVHNLKTC